jgi:ABC-2 type transport system permease protein
METIRAVFAYTLKEHLRHKVWLSSALFGLILLAGGVVVSALAADERARMMLDLGLAANEAIALVSIVFLTVHLILQEIESRAVFLILTHPVRRSHYLLGRFLGTFAAVGLGVLAMGAVHAAALLPFGGFPAGPYAIALACSLAKIAVMGALSLLLSLALTSEAAAMSFALFLWTLGHFTSEIRFIADRSGSSALKTALVAFASAAPDFARLNYRDFWSGPLPGGEWLAWAALYALAYCAACLALAVQVFEQKEF